MNEQLLQGVALDNPLSPLKTESGHTDHSWPATLEDYVKFHYSQQRAGTSDFNVHRFSEIEPSIALSACLTLVE